jgi:hypothetical protein
MVRLTQRLSVLWPRRRGARIAAALVYVLAIAVATGELLGWRFLRDPLAGFLTRAAFAPVEFGGDFRLHLLGPPRMRLATLRVGAGQQVQLEHLLKGEDAELRWRMQDSACCRIKN